MIARQPFGMKERGEAKAVVEASVKAATLIVDDPGRRLAERFLLQFGGRLGVSTQLYDVGLRSGDQLRCDFQVLDAKGIRMPNEALKRSSNGRDIPNSSSAAPIVCVTLRRQGPT